MILEPAEVRSGCTKTIKFKRTDACMACKGTGKLLYGRTCVKCNGRGSYVFDRQLKVCIPAGVKTGQRILIKNEGNHDVDGHRGNLYIEVKIKGESVVQKNSSVSLSKNSVPLVEKTNIKVEKNEITGEYHSVSTLLVPKNIGILAEQILNYIVHTKAMDITEFIRFWIEKKQSKVTIPGCYIIYDEVEQKIYVGQAKNVYGRVKEHIDGRSLYSKNPQMIDKNLCELRHSALIRIIPAFDAGFSDLNEMERVLIAAYDCIEPKGYNLTKGNG